MVACWSWFPSLRTDKLGIVSHKKIKEDIWLTTYSLNIWNLEKVSNEEVRIR